MSLLIYLNSGSEKDYIFKYLMQNVNIYDYFFLTKEQLTTQFLTLIMNSHICKHNIILVFNMNFNFSQISPIVNILKPKMIFALGDERGKNPDMLKLANSTNLLCYQYLCLYKSLPDFLINSHKIVSIPQGFYPGMHLPKPFSNTKRKYIWSFTGNLHHNRKNLIDSFKNLFHEHEYFLSGDFLSREKLFEICENSMFVCNLRGHNILESPRLCYSIRAGAIPIVIGFNLNEIINNFTFNEPLDLPFIYATSVEEAAQKVRSCIENNQVATMSKNCVNWLDKVENYIIHRIYTTMNVTP